MKDESSVARSDQLAGQRLHTSGLAVLLRFNKLPSGLPVAASGLTLQPVPTGSKQHSSIGEVDDEEQRHDA
jgi:hypothetical protein